MIINYINSTLKQLWKNRFFTVVNLMSLSVAFFIAYIVLAYLLFQFSFDKNHEKRDQIFLVQSYLTDFQKSRMRTSYQLGESITQTFPEVQASTRYFHHFRAKVQHMDEDIRAYNFYAADENIFDFFNIPILHQSSAEGLLADRNNILLSHKISKRYFGEEDPIGKTITVKYNGEKHVFTVKAVFYDLPENSSFQPDYLVNINISLDALRLYNNEKDKNAIKTNWSRRDYYTYLLLNKEADGNHLEKKLKGFIAHRSDSVKNTELKLIPLATLYQDLFMEYEVIIILLILGLLVVFVASANYIILSSAISINRSKEIGMRKVMGARPFDIRKQFLGESILLSILAIIPSIFMYIIFLPEVMTILEVPYAFFNSHILNFLPYFILLSILLGFLSGSYVSYGLSNIKVVQVLKSKYLKLSSRSFFRRSLIIFQLFIVMVLLSVVFGIRLQMNYGQQKEMGFDSENIILVNFARGFEKTQVYLDKIQSNPKVISAAAAAFGPPTNTNMSHMISRFDKPEEKIRLEAMAVDVGFMEVFNFELIEGRFFSKEFPSDDECTILNETAVHQLGLENPIGKKVMRKEIIGVIKDFHFHSLHYPIPALNISLDKDHSSQIVIKHKASNEQEMMSFLSKEWEALKTPGHCQIQSFDDTLAELYTKEKTYANIIVLIASIICLIALSGLFGLSLFLIRTKQREVGLRKLFGASIVNIQKALFKEFTVQVLIAFLFACPVAYFIILEYLKMYAYQTPLNIWIFLIPGLITFLVVLLSVVFYLTKAAKTSIVDTLKEE